jgi:uncharacterized protein YkwD
MDDSSAAKAEGILVGKKFMRFMIGICLVACILGSGVVLAAQKEPDEWAKLEIENAISNGLFPMDMRSDYKKPMTRLEFCILTVILYERVYGPIEGRVTFSDTKDVYVEKAASIHVVDGVGGGRFAPESLLTREQAAVMFTRLALSMQCGLEPHKATFSDMSTVSDYAVDAVGRVQHAGIMTGAESKFSPKGAYDRQQGVVTMWRLYEHAVGILGTEGENENGKYSFVYVKYAERNSDAQTLEELVQFINEERKELGVGSVTELSALNEVAMLRAKEQLEVTGHTRPNGKQWNSLLNDRGLNGQCGEIIYRGSSLAKYAVDWWKGSPGHWDILTNGEFTHVGVAICLDDTGMYSAHFVVIFYTIV